MNSKDRGHRAIPRIGFGTWLRNGEQAIRCVRLALEAGYRHVDTAQGYGNEAEVGEALRASGLNRDEVFVTTKVNQTDLGPGMIRPGLMRSLERLGLDSVDLFLIHWPSHGDRFAMEDYIGQLADVFDEGLARQIGVSNFTIPLIDRVVALLGDRPLATNQCEIHVFLQNRPIVEHCRALGIPMTAYSPLARGRVSTDPVLLEIGERHGVSAGQIALAFLLHEGHVVIPTSSNAERIKSNLAVGDIVLDGADMAKIRGLERGMRLVDGAGCPDWDR